MLNWRGLPTAPSSNDSPISNQHFQLSHKRDNQKRLWRTDRRHGVAAQSANRGAISPGADWRSALSSAAAESLLLLGRICRSSAASAAAARGGGRWRIAAKVPGDAMNAGVLREIESSHLLPGLVADRQHQSRISRC